MAELERNPQDLYRRWVDDSARRLRERDRPPRSVREAGRRAEEIRRRIREGESGAFLGGREQAPPAAQVLGVLRRDGYHVERLVFETRPECWATAHAYVPSAGRRPLPAVLCVHGHWAGARRDPVVQSRCIGLAKLGFFVLTLDAWGAGERGTRAGQNEYHGGLLGASLWPVGTPLHGLQLWDNVRALDYLQSRPEVDGERLGCTGASGGGNQTTYLSAFDERVRCAVPVCSVGTFESYLRAACCVDEMLPGGLAVCEEGDLLGMVAPRPLMVITATRDAPHFAPEAARQALDRARPSFQVHGSEDRLRHVLIESGHAYSQPMREAMYGWMRRWLMDEGDGSPVPEPSVQPEEPDALRCFEPAARPEKVMTTARWVHSRAGELAAKVPLPRSASAWEEMREDRLEAVRSLLKLPARHAPRRLPPRDSRITDLGLECYNLETEPGVLIPVAATAPDRKGSPAVLLLHPAGRVTALGSELANALARGGVQNVALTLRGCEGLKLPGQDLGEGLADHNLVEWSLWIDRPLLGQWVHDVLQGVEDARREGGADPDRIVMVGWREAALPALLAAALDRRIRGVAALEPPATFVSEAAPHTWRMAIFQPDLMKIGDLPHLAALAAPRPALVAGPVRLDGMGTTAARVESLYRWPRELYRTLSRPESFTARPDAPAGEVAATLLSWLDKG